MLPRLPALDSPFYAESPLPMCFGSKQPSIFLKLPETPRIRRAYSFSFCWRAAAVRTIGANAEEELRQGHGTPLDLRLNAAYGHLTECLRRNSSAGSETVDSQHLRAGPGGFGTNLRPIGNRSGRAMDLVRGTGARASGGFPRRGALARWTSDGFSKCATSTRITARGREAAKDYYREGDFSRVSGVTRSRPARRSTSRKPPRKGKPMADFKGKPPRLIEKRSRSRISDE